MGSFIASLEDRKKQKIAGYGSFCFGLGGVTTFKKAGMERSFRSLPEDRIVLETDSPYLAPVPHRGKRNEPAYTALWVNGWPTCLERPCQRWLAFDRQCGAVVSPAFIPFDAHDDLPASFWSTRVEPSGPLRIRKQGLCATLTFDHLKSRIPEIDALEVELDFEPLAPIDSSDMTPERWGELARLLFHRDGIVTMGLWCCTAQTPWPTRPVR